jgi:hypothetical protein
VGRVSYSRADFDVAATAASSWILVATTFMWILATTASSQASRPEFQHSFPTFGLGILAAAVGNASVDGIDDTTTFFFVTDGKTYSCLSIHTSSLPPMVRHIHAFQFIL